MKIGAKLKSLRESKGITQKEMEDILDVSHGTYCNWESDLHEVKLSKLPIIAKVLDVDIKELLGEKNNGITISQEFKESTVNGAVIILTDKDSVERLFDLLKDKL